MTRTGRALPVLALAVGTAGQADGDAHGAAGSRVLLPLLGRLSRHCRVVPLGSAEAADAVAVVATGPDAELPPGLPSAVWTAGPVTATGVVLTRSEQLLLETGLLAAGGRGLWVPDGAPPPGARPIGPWVRRRVREARGLPARPLLVEVDGRPTWQGRPVTDLAPALATAAAVAVTGLARAVHALAWGAPLVTDPPTALALGATDQVLVADTEPGRSALAAGLAGDEERAAALSWAGRLLVEARHDAGAAAQRLAAALLPAVPGDAARTALDALHTPPDARVRARLSDALEHLTADLPGRAP